MIAATEIAKMKRSRRELLRGLGREGTPLISAISFFKSFWVHHDLSYRADSCLVQLLAVSISASAQDK